MADFASSSVHPLTILIENDDVPGSKFDREAENYTVEQIKRWLKCRGLKQGGKRAELITRVNNCIKAGTHHILDASIDDGKWFVAKVGRESTKVQSASNQFHGAPSGYVAHIICAETFDKFAREYHTEESKKKLKIVDMGCGTGLAAQTLKEKFGYDNLVALDASEHMLEKARQKGIFDRFIVSYVSNKRVAEIQNGEFDGLVSSAAVTPGQIRPEAFDEILRWMNPGGILCFTCRHDAYVSPEYGYREKFEELENAKKWTLLSNTETDYYCHPKADEFSHSKTRMLVYRVAPF